MRYAYDELRRKGKRIGGITSWDFNEPWTNGAGSYLVDYDGRTVMKYDFVRQALSPVSLTLRYDSILYDPSVGLKAGLWLTSDAPALCGPELGVGGARPQRRCDYPSKRNVLDSPPASNSIAQSKRQAACANSTGANLCRTAVEG